MSYRQVLIARQAKLGVRNQQLQVECGQDSYHIPLADISVLLVESNEVLLSSALISACSQHDVAIVCCDEHHLPTSILLAHNQHYRPLAILELQLAQTQQTKALLTEGLLKQKIQNQIDVLRHCFCSQHAIELLTNYKRQLLLSDDENREGSAAKVFFHALYGNDFVRFQEDYVNAAQNYGYALFRSGLAKALTIHGFTLFLGMNHKGQTNPLNLVYDMIEVYRPIIDYYIYFHNRGEYEETLTLQTKKELIQLLNVIIVFDEIECTVQYSFTLLARAYLNYLENGEQMIYPKIKKINFDVLLESV